MGCWRSQSSTPVKGRRSARFRHAARRSSTVGNIVQKILLSILLGLLVFPAVASAASVDVGQSLSVGLKDSINSVISAAIAALIGWVAIIIKNKFKIDIEGQYRDALVTFLQRQASSLIADGAVNLSGVKVDVHSEALAKAADAALLAIPDTLKCFGLTPEHLKEMIVDMVPKEPAVAHAVAIGHAKQAELAVAQAAAVASDQAKQGEPAVAQAAAVASDQAKQAEPAVAQAAAVASDQANGQSRPSPGRLRSRAIRQNRQIRPSPRRLRSRVIRQTGRVDRPGRYGRD